MKTQTVTVTAGDTLESKQVGGDLMLQGWDRSEVEARGDFVHVQKDGNLVAVRCTGDLTLSVPKGMSVSLKNTGGSVTVQDLSGNVELGLIGGDATLRNLTGSVRLSGMIGGETHMENVANVSMSYSAKGLGVEFGDRIRQKVQKATERAERKIRRAQARVYQPDGIGWQYNSGSDASSAPQPGEPVSEEERLTILRMLQEKKITAEQAEKLLSALEGDA